MVLLPLPPAMCFCGRNAVESHEFLFCSTECACLDSRSLGNVVRHTYVQAGAPELQPRRMASATHLRPGHSQRHPFADATPLPQESYATLALIAPWTTLENNNNTAAFPMHPGKGPTRMAAAGASATERYYPSRQENFVNVPSCGHAMTGPGGHTFQQVSLDEISLPESAPLVPLRRVPSATEGHKAKKSPVAALLSFGRSRKGKEVESLQRAFGSPVNMGVPARKEFRKGGHF